MTLLTDDDQLTAPPGTRMGEMSLPGVCRHDIIQYNSHERIYCTPLINAIISIRSPPFPSNPHQHLLPPPTTPSDTQN